MSEQQQQLKINMKIEFLKNNGSYGTRVFAVEDRTFNKGEILNIDLNTGAEGSYHALYNPEPSGVVAGRPMLYDAYNTSSNGEASCSSCHIFGDMDHIAWDLGNPSTCCARHLDGRGLF